jgi:superfamily II DNA or RNA helicase
MKISIEHHISTVEEYDEEDLIWLGSMLSIKQPQFRKNFETGRMERTGIDTITFLDRHGRFPSGFIPAVVRRAKRRAVELQFEDKRLTKPIEPDPNADISFLRYYQLDAIERVIKRKRGIIWHPTGAGKTVVAAGLSIKLPCFWVFIVQSKDLLHQTAEKYTEFTGKEAGIIGDGIFRQPGEEANLLVATAQTLNAKKGDDRVWEFIEYADGLIIDECHTTPATTIFQVLMRAERACYRVGLSGTPLARTDRKGMLTIGALGDIIHRVEPNELIEKGYLSQPKIEMWKCWQEVERPTYHGRYNEAIVRSTKRNKLVTRLMTKAHTPNFTFVRKIDHGRALTRRAQKAGLNVEFVWGKKTRPQRDAALKRLVRGEVDYIICSAVFVMGIDVPELRSVVNAAAGKSAIDTLQRIGRGSRVTADKNTFEVFDIFDTGTSNLEDHAKIRRREYKREGYTVTEIDEGALL